MDRQKWSVYIVATKWNNVVVSSTSHSRWHSKRKDTHKCTPWPYGKWSWIIAFMHGVTCYEGLGQFVGIANNIAGIFTYTLLSDNTCQVLSWSFICSLDPDNQNILIRTLHGNEEFDEEPPFRVVNTTRDVINPNYDPSNTKLPHFSQEELLWCTVL